jgi:cobalt/nickel transport protein
MLYTPETALTRGAATHLVMLFTHPAHGGPHMAMGAPEAFYVVSQRGEDADRVRTDLLEFVEPIEWRVAGPASAAAAASGAASRGAGSAGAASGGEASAPSGGELPAGTAAYEAVLPRDVTRSLGDYVFVLEPAPYYEAGEDKYIQQLTKTMVNVGGVPGNWAEPVGLPTEILPLDKPYANWTGGVFRGVVLSAGEPVPHAELEVEYVNYAPDLDARSFAARPAVELPQDSFGTMSIRANALGEFSIGLARAGWWGICALAVGPDTEHEGKTLSQDAVLWVQAKDMR